MFPANVRVDWKVIACYKHSSLFGFINSDEGKNIFLTFTPGCQEQETDEERKEGSWARGLLGRLPQGCPRSETNTGESPKTVEVVAGGGRLLRRLASSLPRRQPQCAEDEPL